MTKRLFWVVVLLVSLCQQVWAQDRAISGKITDRATGQGLPGVTIIVKGQPTIGTSTNSDGAYSLNVPASATALIFSFVGYATQEAPITGSNTVSLALASDTKVLNEVVVTALGVERTRNSLSYAATQVEGQDITVARNPNPINGLEGKVAGLNITQGNGLGSSSNVVIRGTKSVTGNNQALFVVDGVPISNQNVSGSGQAAGGLGYDFGNAAADINPDDIASTTVLKGAAATALYGSRAANGVILITTKKGRRGFGVNVNSGVTLGRVDKSTFIQYQKQYGGGYGKYYGPNSNDYYNRDASGALVVPTSEDASYGGAFDPNLMIRQWYSYTPGDPNFGKATPWVAADNDPNSFFQTAVSTLNTITIDGGNDQGTFKLGYNNNIDRGVLPNSKIVKNTINFAGSLNLSPKLTISSTVNFARIDGLGRYGTGYNSINPMTNFREWWQTNVDIKQLKEAYDRNPLSNPTWNYSSPENGDLSAIYWNNPYFTRYQNYETDTRFRTFGNVMANYKVFKGFEIVGRVTADSYDELIEQRQAVNSTSNDGFPFYSRYNHTFREFNFDLFANVNKSLGEAFSLRGVAGVNLRRQYNNSISAATNGGLVIPGLYSLSNSVSSINAPAESAQQIGVDGVFASATLGFRERVFLDITGRMDKSTTLPQANNTYFYPSVSLGYVFSEDLRDSAPWLSYGKIRANYAEVGNDAPIYSVNDVYRKPAVFGSVPLFAIPTTKNNPDLKSERTRSFEAGIETSFADSRVGLEATVYQTSTINQIIPVNISAATGYISRYINSGEVRNRGLELTAYVVPVKTNDFNWRIGANWTKNENRVISLYEQNGVVVDNILIATYQGGVSSNATIGRAYGSLRGSNYVYNDAGQKVVGTNGYYLMTGADQVIGDPNPRWRAGITNTITYKSISLNFLVDIKSGGSVFSLDRYYGLATGLQPETAGLNDLGNPSRNTIANGGGVILPGVKADGTPNTTRVSNTNYGLYGYVRNPNAAFVYDGSFVKLREVALTFGLPKSILAKTTFLKAIDLSIVGRNLWIIHKNLPDADPEDFASSGNIGLGYQVGSYPAVRTLGANLRLSF